MMVSEADIQRLKEHIISEYADEATEPGTIITLSCTDGLVWEDGESGEKHYGCGQELARFIYTGDSDNTWNIAADMYISHLHNAHEYRVSINPLDVTG